MNGFGPTPYIDRELANDKANNPARWTSRELDDRTVSALADWIHEPDDETEGQARAIRAVEIARSRGMLPELLDEVIKPRRRVCARCEGDGMIGDGYRCEVCDGSGYDR